ncbi:hypothetical protein QO058_29650 (plasmid) [Bosea vestrisii]|uniref:hypothetical protein n=1 Tax=Bosea vestrisii TaxID=151416 RepID=UPI0024DF3E7B|nr:hypothetical protein [Bosea vestrisii]WID99891.1 hypothetical protein QO058_29650 [Bosea vestrisii]
MEEDETALGLVPSLLHGQQMVPKQAEAPTCRAMQSADPSFDTASVDRPADRRQTDVLILFQADHCPVSSIQSILEQPCMKQIRNPKADERN